MHNTWVTGDWHLDHRNILRYDVRPWINIHVMNLALITNTLCLVDKEDTLIYVGDLALTTRDRYVGWLKLVKSLWPNIILIHGNHDKGYNSDVWEEAGVSVRKEYYWNGCIFTHRPIEEVPDNYVNVHGHTHKPATDEKHVCVSVNQTNYFPVRLK